MKRRPVAICCDIDDCLINFLEPFLDSYNAEYNKQISLSDLTDYQFSLSLQKYLKKVELEGIYTRLPIAYGATAFLKGLDDLRIKLILITARPKDFKRDTVISLINNKIKYEDLIFAKNKSEIIIDLKSDYDILGMIDDRASTVIKVSERCDLDYNFLINKPHNESVVIPENVTRVPYILDILKLLEGV